MKHIKVVLMALVGLLFMASTANAFTVYKTNFTTKYPTLGTNLTAKVNNCTICHATANTSGNPTLYGTALRNAGSGVAIATRIAGLEGTDTDNDGFTNLQEIMADTDFNDAASKPTAPIAGTTPPASTTFSISSTSFTDGAAMPTNLACVADGGSNTSPQISLANLPVGTLGVAVIMEDTTTPTPTVHWGMFQLPALIPATGKLGFTSIPEGQAVTQTQIEALDPTTGGFPTTTAAQNYTGGVGYAGACPSSAQHTYKITALALDKIETNVGQYFGTKHSTNSLYTSVYTQILAGPTVAEFKAALPAGEKVLGQAILMGGFPSALSSGGGTTGSGTTGSGTPSSNTPPASSSSSGGCMTSWHVESGFPVLILLLLGGIAMVRKRV